MPAGRHFARNVASVVTFLVVAVLLTVLLANVTDWPQLLRVALVVVCAAVAASVASNAVAGRLPNDRR